MTAGENNANWEQAKHGPAASGPIRKNLADENKKKSKQEPNNKHASRNVTIHTTEGRYEAKLAVDNSNYCPAQKKMYIARYSISEPP